MTRSTVLAGGAALVGGSLTEVPHAAIVLTDGVVAAVGPVADVRAPRDAATIDTTGMIVIPGFIDAHVHIALSDPHEVVRRGVTTARDLGWPPDEIFELVTRSRSDRRIPLILAAGPMLTAAGGYPMRAAWAPAETGLPVEHAEDAAPVVDDLRARGATVVKVALNPPVGPVLSDPVLRAIVNAAHAHDLRVTAHIHGIDELERAIDAGVDELAHMVMGNEHLPETMIAAMVAAEIMVVPTLAIRYGFELDVAIDNLTRFRAAGGRLLYGTDLGNYGPQPGIDGFEISALARAGMDVVDIIRSATVDAAEWLELEDRGLLRAGAVADVVVLEGSLRDGPAVLTNVAMVWREGVRVR